MLRPSLVLVLALGACKSAAPAAAPDCGTLAADNAVRTEMVRLECALQHAVSAIARDDLAAIPRSLEVVDAAKHETEHALETGAYKLQGDLASFKAMDEAFHHSLESLLDAARRNDHAATAAALGGVLGQCQGCHAAFRKK